MSASTSKYHPEPQVSHHAPTIALLSTYPPTQCGLATFTAALYEQLSKSSGHIGIVRVLADSEEKNSGPEVVAHLINGSESSSNSVIQTLNLYDVVVIQHEYGIYEGPDGEDILKIAESLAVPTILVPHTVLLDPTPRQRHILDRLVRACDLVVTMTETARLRLIENYGVDQSHITVIPHGAIDHRTFQNHHLVPSHCPSSANSRPVILTWGLLGPGKGIEWAIDAMPGMRDLMPIYLVVGKTHPKVLERYGEEYRLSLAARVDANKVADIVDIDPSYLELPALAKLVESADVVLLPYDSPDQVTSGVLIEAIAAGRPVVSTAFPHAVELLTSGSGLIVPRQDPDAMQLALRRILTEPELAKEMARHAALQAPALRWGAVAKRYRKAAAQIANSRSFAS
ncbi:MAG: glycosyltransferase [Acidimicrobiaceae bacterium]|nr:glycosyltransferase [Acidimicrobiaceae bacterium]